MYAIDEWDVHKGARGRHRETSSRNCVNETHILGYDPLSYFFGSERKEIEFNLSTVRKNEVPRSLRFISNDQCAV